MNADIDPVDIVQVSSVMHVDVGDEEMEVSAPCSDIIVTAQRKSSRRPFSCTESGLSSNAPSPQDLRAQREVQQAMACSTSRPSASGHAGRRSIRHHAVILQEEANVPHMRPRQSKRTAVPQPVMPLDLPLLESRETYGSRLEYRVGQIYPLITRYYKIRVYFLQINLPKETF